MKTVLTGLKKFFSSKGFKISFYSILVLAYLDFFIRIVPHKVSQIINGEVLPALDWITFTLVLVIAIQNIFKIIRVKIEINYEDESSVN